MFIVHLLAGSEKSKTVQCLESEHLSRSRGLHYTFALSSWLLLQNGNTSVCLDHRIAVIDVGEKLSAMSCILLFLLLSLMRLIMMVMVVMTLLSSVKY